MVSSLRKWFRILIFFPIGLGVIALSRCFNEMPLRHDLTRDLGIAIVVSTFVAVFIEYQREEETRKDAVDVFMGRIIPIRVWDDFRNNIIARQVICESWDLDIFITRAQVTMEGGGPQEQFVATGTMVYKLNNLNNLIRSEQLPKLWHELESDFRGVDQAGRELPRFILMSWTAEGEDAKLWDEEKLREFVQEGKLTVPSSALPKKSHGPVEVVVKRKEIIPIPGGFPWYMYWITLKCKITIRTNVEGLTFDLWPRHHQPEKFRPLLPGDTWSFDGVLFPGQGFEIQCKRKES
jgi:hypothetical protein